MGVITVNLRFLSHKGGTMYQHYGVSWSPELLSVSRNTMTTTEYAQLAILYCDLSRSSYLSTVLDPETLRELLLIYRHRVAECVQKGGGIIAEVNGDGLVAYFGYPHSTEHDAEAAIRAARRACHVTSKICVKGHEIAMHATVATGNVIVGTTEDQLLSGASTEAKWSDFIAFGEALNLASRLLDLSKPGEVVICDTTHTLTGKLFSYTEITPHTLKGFKEPVVSWRVDGENAVASRFLALRERALAPIIGRSEELEFIDNLWNKKVIGEKCGQAVLIHGESGIGKSRLTEEVIDTIIPSDSVWLRYFTAPHLQQTPYGVLINQMTWAAQLSEHDSDEECVTKIKETIPPNVENFDGVVEMFAYLLSLRQSKAYPQFQLSAKRLQQHIFDTFVGLTHALAVEKPMLIIIEDVHWLDSMSQLFLEKLVAAIDDLPVLLLMTARPDGMDRVDSTTTQLPLNPLSKKDASILISSIGKKLGASFTADVVSNIAERADGIPLFIEDITQYYVEQSGSKKGETNPLNQIPVKLQGSLKVRLDSLADAKRIAQLASVYGREFPSLELQEILNVDANVFRRGIAQLLNSGLVSTIPAGGWFRYQFKHALVRDTAYNTLTHSERVLYHYAVAEAFERRGDAAVLPSEVIAEHFYLGAKPAKAIEYLMKAGQHAVSRSIFSSAVVHFKRALEISRTQSFGKQRQQQKLALMTAIGSALAGDGGFADPESGATFEKSLRLCESMPESDEVFAAYSGAGSYHITAGDFERVESIANQCIERAEKQTRTTPHVIGYRLRGGAQFVTGRLSDAHTSLEKTIHLYDKIQQNNEATSYVFTQDHTSTAHCYLGLLLAVSGRPDEARRIGEEGLAHSREKCNLHTLNFSLCFFGAMMHLIRDNDEAIRHATESYEIAQRNGFGTWSGISQVLRGESLIQQGDVEGGIADVMQGVQGHADSQALTYQAFGISLLVKSLQAVGKFDEAKSYLQSAIALTEKINEVWYLPELLRLSAKDLSLRGDSQEAHATIDKAMKLASDQGALLWELKCATQKAQMYVESDDRTLAAQCLEGVYERFDHNVRSEHLTRARSVLESVA